MGGPGVEDEVGFCAGRAPGEVLDTGDGEGRGREALAGSRLEGRGLEKRFCCAGRGRGFVTYVPATVLGAFAQYQVRGTSVDRVTLVVGTAKLGKAGSRKKSEENKKMKLNMLAVASGFGKYYQHRWFEGRLRFDVLLRMLRTGWPRDSYRNGKSRS